VSDWSQIQYREYHDFPRAVVAVRNSQLYFFDSRFDESIDDYIDHYEVWLLPILSPEILRGSWIGLEKLALGRLPDIGLRDLPFEILSRHDSGGYKSGKRHS
jgi:hypothetical protein